MRICDHCKKRTNKHKSYDQYLETPKKIITDKQEVKDQMKNRCNMWLSEIKHLLKGKCSDKDYNLSMDISQRRVYSDTHMNKIPKKPQLNKDQRDSYRHFQGLDIAGLFATKKKQIPHLLHYESSITLSSHKDTEKQLKVGSTSVQSDKNSYKTIIKGKPDANCYDAPLSGITSARAFQNRNQFIGINKAYFGIEISAPELETVDLIPEILTNITSSQTKEVNQDSKPNKILCFKDKISTENIRTIESSKVSKVSREIIDTVPAQLPSKINDYLDSVEPAILKVRPDIDRSDYFTNLDKIKFINSHFRDDVNGEKLVSEVDFEFRFPRTKYLVKPKCTISSSELIKETQDMLLVKADQEKKTLEEERKRKQTEDEKKFTLKEKSKPKEEKGKAMEKELILLTEKTRQHTNDNYKIEQNMLEVQQKQEEIGKIKLKNKAIASSTTPFSKNKIVNTKSVKLKLTKSNHNIGKEMNVLRKDEGNKDKLGFVRKQTEEKQPLTKMKGAPIQREQNEKNEKNDKRMEHKSTLKGTEKHKDEKLSYKEQSFKIKDESDTKVRKLKEIEYKEKDMKTTDQKYTVKQQEKNSTDVNKRLKKEADYSIEKEENLKIKEIKQKDKTLEREDKLRIKEEQHKRGPDKEMDPANKLLLEQNKQQRNEINSKKQHEEDEKNLREAAEKKTIENEILAMKKNREAKAEKKSDPVKEQSERMKEKTNSKHNEVRSCEIKDNKSQCTKHLIPKLARLGECDKKNIKENIQGLNKAAALEMLKEHRLHHENAKTLTCLMCINSDLAIDIEEKFGRDFQEMDEIIIGQKIFKYKPPYVQKEEDRIIVPILFESVFHGEIADKHFNEIPVLAPPIFSESIEQRLTLLPKVVKSVSTIIYYYLRFLR